MIFSPIAGVVVDRFPKKWILVGSNLTRVIFAVSYVIILRTLTGTWELVAFYTVTFLGASLAQFFAPAEASTIPLLVGESLLLPANSLFTLTMALSQVIGLLVIGPLAVSLLHVQGGFLLIGMLYLGATLLVLRLPKDKPHKGTSTSNELSVWRQFWTEFKEGWQFVIGHPKVLSPMMQLVTIATMVMVMAMLVPGYTARVLGMAAQNAVLVFLPAGIGMLLATAFVGRWGHLLRRAGFGYIGLLLVGLAFAAMGWLSQDYQRLLRPILHVYPQATFSLTTATMALGLAWACVWRVSISWRRRRCSSSRPPYIRGRVFSVQFMLNNLVGIPPMLALGGMADAIGIPRVMEIVGLGVIVMAGVSLVIGRLNANVNTGVGRCHDEPRCVGFLSG